MSRAGGANRHVQCGAGSEQVLYRRAQVPQPASARAAQLPVRAVARCLVALVVIWAAPVLGGPVDLYLDGPRFCPHDVPAGAPRINEVQAIARSQALLPVGFCGPSAFVSGCTFDTDNQYDSWRIYAHQYKLRGGTKDKGGLSHTYLILDAVGNCLAHIPGTEFGANN